ncbi:MAG: RNAase P [Candidatus Micrarchaeota archaeon]|nr:RNAase P [Candidatus Micrarchaeota archaeon]
MAAKKRKQGGIQELIRERIDILLSMACRALKEGKEVHARRYVFLARKLSTRFNCRLSPRQKALFCKKCGVPLVAGLNASVRLKKRRRSAEYRCSCGASRYFKY